MGGKKKQAPKHTWRYGCAKRIYVTRIPGQRFQETLYELVEVYDQGKSWTATAVTMGAGSKKDLVKWLRQAADDIEKYDTIVEKKPIVRKIGYDQKP